MLRLINMLIVVIVDVWCNYSCVVKLEILESKTWVYEKPKQGPDSRIQREDLQQSLHSAADSQSDGRLREWH